MRVPVAGRAEHGQIVEAHGPAFGDGYYVVDGEPIGGAAAHTLAVAL